MRRILISAAAALILLLAGNAPSPQASAPDGVATTDPALEALLAAECADGTADAIAQAAAKLPQEGGVASDDWPPHAIGGVIPPVRSVSDPFPTFDGVAIDTENNRVIFSDENRHSLLVYERTAGGSSTDTTEPIQWVFGPRTQLGYIAGVEVDPKRKEFYTVNNDGGDKMVVFAYDDHGNVQPRRTLTLPHQSWDVALASERDEIAITVHAATANGDVAAKRTITGDRTGLNWPMGIDVDLTHDEIAVANYGDSSIRVFRRGDMGNAQPLRVLRGALTQIVGPVSVAVDAVNDELWVANYGDHTAAVFPRTASGNVRPKRIIRNAPKDTPTCGFTNASAAAYDSKRDEILVPN